MRMRQHNAANVRNADARFSEPIAERFVSLFGLGPGIDQRDGIFGNQIDVDRSNVEGCRERDGDDFHLWLIRVFDFELVQALLETLHALSLLYFCSWSCQLDNVVLEYLSSEVRQPNVAIDARYFPLLI